MSPCCAPAKGRRTCSASSSPRMRSVGRTQTGIHRNGEIFRCVWISAMALDPETLAALLDTVRRFVSQRLRPAEAEVARNDCVPSEIVTEMKELGLFGLSIPVEYGGLGLSMAEEVQVALLLGGTSPAFRSLLGTNNGIGSQGIVIDGTAEQKERLLPRLATGDLIGSFCLTEPDAGSDAGSLRTSAKP